MSQEFAQSMYSDYFGLKGSPFTISPDPRYLYMSDQHREALAHLVYGIRDSGSFVLLTGEVGTGKTTVCHSLLEQVPANTQLAFILNPKLTASELIATICDELGADYPNASASLKILVDALNQKLLANHSEGKRTIVVIDEAQNLSADVLEQLRLLTNLQTSTDQLIKFILLGQPELLKLLQQPQLRQLAQRITARFHLTPLSFAETQQYIAHRLGVVGMYQTLFPASVMGQVFRLSRGIPRLINIICDRALLGAYAERKNVVDKKTLMKAAAEIFGDVTDTPNPRAKVGKGLMIVVVIVLTALGLYWLDRTYQLRERLGWPGQAVIEAPATPSASPLAE